jgi:uncharacterized OsmC-like protein
MSLEVEVKLLEDQRFEVNALKSGAKAYMDTKREGYTPCAPNPSELFLASLGGCVLYYAWRYLSNAGIEFKELSVKVSGEWAKEPLMLKDIKVEISTNAELGNRKEALLRFVHNCPIHNTIINTQKINIQFLEEGHG